MRLEEAHLICALHPWCIPGSYFTYAEKVFGVFRLRKSSEVCIRQHDCDMWGTGRTCGAGKLCVWSDVTRWIKKKNPRLPALAAVWAQDGYSGMPFAEFVNVALGLPTA